MERKAPFVVFVNIWQTKSTPWIVSNRLPSSALEEPDAPPLELLELVRQAVASLPTVISLPKVWSPSGIPRYYMVAFDFDGEKVEIVDIVGVRADGSPTKWSYKAGYWHPTVQHAIVKALQRALRAEEEK